MRLGVHALVWVGGWSPEEARQAIASSAQAGYDLIEIPLLDPSSVDAVDTRRVLDEHGLEAACSLGLSPEADVSSEDPAAVAGAAGCWPTRCRRSSTCAPTTSTACSGGTMPR